MKKLLLIFAVGLMSCSDRQGIIFEKQGFIFDRGNYNLSDTLYRYKVKDLITKNYVTVYKRGKFNVGDQIGWRE